MDANGSGPTPEKQLLKLIEQPHQAAVKGEAARRSGAGALSPSAIRGRFSFLSSAASGLFRGGKGRVGLKGANKLLAAAAVMLVILLGWDVAVSWDEVRTVPELEPEPLKHYTVGAPLTPKKTAEDYNRVWEGRDPFDFFVEVKRIEADVPQVTEDELIKREMASEMEGLMYVSYRKVNKQLIARIRDGTGERHKLKAGDRLGGLKIVVVFRDKVVVSYRGVEDELPLGGR
jgi:hypothetical protein